MPATRGLKKDSDRAILLRQRRSMSLHIWHRQGLHKPSSCAAYMLKTLTGEELPQAKKVLRLCAQGRFGLV